MLSVSNHFHSAAEANHHEQSPHQCTKHLCDFDCEWYIVNPSKNWRTQSWILLTFAHLYIFLLSPFACLDSPLIKHFTWKKFSSLKLCPWLSSVSSFSIHPKPSVWKRVKLKRKSLVLFCFAFTGIKALLPNSLLLYIPYSIFPAMHRNGLFSWKGWSTVVLMISLDAFLLLNPFKRLLSFILFSFDTDATTASAWSKITYNLLRGIHLQASTVQVTICLSPKIAKFYGNI